MAQIRVISYLDSKGREKTLKARVDRLDSEIRSLEAHHAVVLETRPDVRTGSIAQSRLSRSKSKQIQYLSNLAELLGSGVPLASALETLSRSGRQSSLFNMPLHIEDEVSAGISLSQALENVGFDAVTVALVNAGESSGKVAISLEKASRRLEEARDSLRSIASKAAYPILLLFVSVLILVFLMRAVIPNLLSNLRLEAHEMPASTQFLISSYSFFNDVGWVLFASLVFSVAGFFLKNPWPPFEIVRSRVVVQNFVFGRYYRQYCESNFFLVLGWLLTASVSLDRSFRLSIPTLSNRYLMSEYEQKLARVLEGEALSKVFSDLRPEYIQLIEAGELSGNLEKPFGNIGGLMKNRFERTMAFVTRIIEPAVIIMVGTMLTMFALAILEPMLNATNSL